LSFAFRIRIGIEEIGEGNGCKMKKYNQTGVLLNK
jgi:hypothetical protein